MATKKHIVIINGQELDYNSLEDSVQLQAHLLPKGFRGDKPQAVRLFLNLRNMLQAQFDKHFVHNYPRYLRAAADLQDDGEAPKVAGGFRFELDFTAETVAAIGQTKMGGSMPFGSTSKAQAHDINQGDLFEDNSGLDPTSDGSIAAEREREAQEEKEADEAKAKRDEEKAREKAEKEKAKLEELPGAASEPVKQPKKKGSKKKKKE